MASRFTPPPPNRFEFTGTRCRATGRRSVSASIGAGAVPAFPMTRDDDLFGEALELPVMERAAFLDRVCNGDFALRARVEALLAGFDRAGQFLEQPLAGNPTRPLDEQPGDIIGPYTLIEKIGEGGCGAVYLAEQKSPIRRRVALKIIKLGMDTRQVIARFSGERQALALMDHPDIARVLDAGATEAGRPYFVMDLVDGVPITRFCDEHRLSVPVRLDLFARVCLALQHAHQKGIIHRDVKPSNILVVMRDGVPAPRVIDFGIAKATQERLTDQTLLTGIDQVIGTPAYMSPEQADHREADIDTRSDIYSLGVLLYELLTGRLPFDPDALRNAGLEKVRQLLRETEPARPSLQVAALPAVEGRLEAERRATTAGGLVAALQGDLDWIVMRCLEKERDRRYGSAQELADDLRRHLHREPVMARPPSTWYRASRFVSRHRVACASAVIIALTLVTGTIVSVDQAVRATRAEHHAKAERDTANAASRAAAQARADALRRQEQAEDLLTFMLGSFRAELKNTRLETLNAVDAKAMAYFASLDPRDLDDTVLTRQTKALYQIGETRMEEARYADAATAFAASYERAAALVVRHPRDADMLFERAQAEYWIGFVAWRRGDFATAGDWLTRYRDSALALSTLEAGKLRAQHEVGYGYHNLAVLDVSRGKLEAARHGFAAERTAVETMLASNPDDVSLQFSLADIASWQGTVAEADGRYAEAVGHYSECSSRFEELMKREPKAPRWRLRLADSEGLTGDLFAVTGRHADAAATYARVRTLRAALVQQDPKNRLWQYAALNGRLHEITRLLVPSGDPTLVTELAGIRTQLEGLVKAEPSSTVFAAALATAWRLEAELRFSAHRPDAAEAIDQALQLGEPLITEARADSRSTGEFALACVLAGRIAQAAGDDRGARRHWERTLGALKPRLDQSNDWRLLDPAVQALSLLDRVDEAHPLAERLRRFGYRALDPFAASVLDAAIVQSSSNSNQ